MSYYALRKGEEIIIDPRLGPDRQPLRESLRWPSLGCTQSRSQSSFLYAAQTSIVVTGLDHSIWSAYASVDTYFDPEYSVENHHQYRTRETREAKVWDALAGPRRLWADEPIWTPREYFLRVVECRSSDILVEWQEIVSKVESTVKERHSDPRRSLVGIDQREISVLTATRRNRMSRRSPPSDEHIGERLDWNNCVLDLLKRLNSCLEENIDAWDTFESGHIGYFCPLTGTPDLQTYLNSITTTYSKLRQLLSTLRRVKEEVSSDNEKAASPSTVVVSAYGVAMQTVLTFAIASHPHAVRELAIHQVPAPHGTQSPASCTH
jgi:hypothetical protein